VSTVRDLVLFVEFASALVAYTESQKRLKMSRISADGLNSFTANSDRKFSAKLPQTREHVMDYLDDKILC